MFTVNIYTNNLLVKSINGLLFSMAYIIAVPPESHLPCDGNRWHVLLRDQALIKAQKLFAGETICIAWEDKVKGLDFSHILMVREEILCKEMLREDDEIVDDDAIHSPLIAHQKAVILHKNLTQSS